VRKLCPVRHWDRHSYPDQRSDRETLVSTLEECLKTRSKARTGTDGSLILLADQDRACGDAHLIAAISAVHSDARSAAETDWGQILALHDQLNAPEPNAVFALNRSVAIGEVIGPEAALVQVDALAAPLDDFYPLHAIRADSLPRLGRTDEAQIAHSLALARTSNRAEAALLTQAQRALNRDAPGRANG
jgi:RNA polymerase sigma-70 factor, ECF subfamily